MHGSDSANYLRFRGNNKPASHILIGIFLSDLQGIFVELASPVLLNNVVRIKCCVDTNQPVKFSWFKDNIALDMTEDKEHGICGTLRIIDYKVSDNGIYSCEARTDFKVITSKGIKVFGKGELNFIAAVYDVERGYKPFWHLCNI